MDFNGTVLTDTEAAALENLGHYAWDEFVTRAANRWPNGGTIGADATSADPHDSWAGASLNKAMEYAQHGWHDGVALVSANLDRLPPTSDVLPDWSLDVAGSICNVPAFITGEPECMWRMSEQKRADRRLSIVVNGFISSGIDQSAGVAYASAVSALIRGLEASGVDAAVYLITPTKDARGSTRHNAAAYAVTVREFGEPLDIAKMAFAFHPAFYRRVQFAWQETNQEANRYGLGNGGYGRPVQLDKAVVDKMLGNVGYVAIMPSINMLHNKNPERMLKALKQAAEAAVATY